MLNCQVQSVISRRSIGFLQGCNNVIAIVQVIHIQSVHHLVTVKDGADPGSIFLNIQSVNDLFSKSHLIFEIFVRHRRCRVECKDDVANAIFAYWIKKNEVKFTILIK